MEPDLNYITQQLEKEEREINQKQETKQFKNKIGKQRRNCWWN